MLPIQLILLLFLACVANGATYYVATTGNNGNAGSIGAPWLTIRYGVNTMAASDTLNVRAGTYADDGFLLDGFKSGTTGSPTIIQNYNGESVTYYPQVVGEYSAHGILLSGKSNIVFSGININATACTSDGIKLTDGARDITITNLAVWGCPRGMGLLTTGLSEGALMNSLVTHCSFITNGWNATTNDAPLHQIYIQTSGVTVENCYIQGITNVGGGTLGIHYFGSTATNGTFRNNWITNCTTGVGALSTYGSNCFIYNNIIGGGYSWAVSINAMSEVSVFNNTCVSNLGGINVNGSTNITVENNITTGGGNNFGNLNNPGGIYIQGSSDTVTIRNNLSYTNHQAYSDYRQTTAYNITKSANLFGIEEVSGVKTTNSYAYDAKFVNSQNNFHLTAGSSAIGTGRPQTLFSNDFYGSIRSTWDIGAVLYPLFVWNIQTMRLN